MVNCPKCHQPVNTQAIACPHCRTALKAFGHPGIPLHRAEKDTYLCDRCTYHADDTCNFPQRPYAKECTLYQDHTQPLLDLTQNYPIRLSQRIRFWCQQNQVWLMLIGLGIISFIVALRSMSK